MIRAMEAISPAADPTYQDKYGMVDPAKEPAAFVTESAAPTDGRSAYPVPNTVRRNLRMHHVQLIAFGGAIGASVFISIGNPLTQAGPMALLIGMFIWATCIWGFAMCLIEMITLFPFSGGFVYLAGRFLDPSAQFALGYNYFVGCCGLVCFEVNAVVVLAQYWKADINPLALLIPALLLLFTMNMAPVRIYGEIEFYIAITKIILIIGLILYTFVTMLGGNPLGDRYGFRFWKDPGLFVAKDGWGRLKGIWSAIVWSTFAIGGPEYVSMVCGEVRNPRRILPKAYNSTVYRIIGLYMGSALAVTVNAPYNDESLLGAIAAGAPGAAKSPFIISMNRLQIPVLPAIVNAAVVLSVFSAGSSYTFMASRTLYGLSLQRQAPRVFSRTSRWGVPYVAVTLVMAIGCLSFLTMNNGAVKVLNWFINLTSSTQLILWINIGATYFRFRAGLKAQNLPRSFLPARGVFQPYLGALALTLSIIILIFVGYYLMAPGAFAAADFVFAYGAVFLYAALFIMWKIKGILSGQQRGIGHRASEMDFVSGLEEIEQETEDAEAERLAAAGEGWKAMLSEMSGSINQRMSGGQRA